MLTSRIVRRARAVAWRPRLRATEGVELIRLGSSYGGWDLVDASNLLGSTIISAGLGEDASFDIDFAARYRARVVIVDPTPRAVTHHSLIIAHLGRARLHPYVSGGHQPVQSYDLTEIGAEQLPLVKRALWNDSGTVDFFTPPDPRHVSHSIVNFQRGYRTDTEHIRVETTTLHELLNEFSIAHLPLLKLDIEGAEVEVLADMLKAGILPDQVLVEYDEIGAPSRTGRARVKRAHTAIVRAGYELIRMSRQGNCLYLRSV